MNLPVGQEVRLPAGQFIRRPPHLLGIVNEPFAAAAIYPAVLAAWTYLVFFEHPSVARLSALTLFVVGFVGILLYDQSLKRDSYLGRLRRRPQQPAPRAAVDEPAGTGPAPTGG